MITWLIINYGLTSFPTLRALIDILKSLVNLCSEHQVLQVRLRNVVFLMTALFYLHCYVIWLLSSVMIHRENDISGCQNGTVLNKGYYLQ
jgi:hypothetical protein